MRAFTFRHAHQSIRPNEKTMYFFGSVTPWELLLHFFRYKVTSNTSWSSTCRISEVREILWLEIRWKLRITELRWEPHFWENRIFFSVCTDLRGKRSWTVLMLQKTGLVYLKCTVSITGGQINCFLYILNEKLSCFRVCPRSADSHDATPRWRSH